MSREPSLVVGSLPFLGSLPPRSFSSASLSRSALALTGVLNALAASPDGWPDFPTRCASGSGTWPSGPATPRGAAPWAFRDDIGPSRVIFASEEEPPLPLKEEGVDELASSTALASAGSPSAA